MAYGDKEAFVKIKDGVKAPAGFHYMPSGRLMSDADHVAVHGYIERKITSFDVDTRDILNEGEIRNFSIRGDKGAIFSLEIYDNTGKYYNFYTETWSTEKAILSKQRIQTSTYSVNIDFDKLPDSSLKTYTVNLFAETVHNIKTTHAELAESRNADNSINVNATIGSNSNILTRIMYQDALKVLKLSCIAPSLYEAGSSTIDGATSSSNRIVIADFATNENIVRVGDKIVTTGIDADAHALVTKVDPDGDNTKEIEISISDSVTNEAVVSFTPPFNGITPHDDDSDTGASTASLSSGNSTKIGFSLGITPPTGRMFSILKTPTTNDLCAYTTVTFGSAALAIEGEDTSSSTYYRWPITNIANLKQGMILDPTRSGFTSAPAVIPALISNYSTTTTRDVFKEGGYDNYVDSVTVGDVFVDGVDAYGNDVTAVDRNGRITAQAGNIVFSQQQADALKSDAGVRIFGYGAENIKALTGVGVKLNVTSMAYRGDGTNAPISTTTTSVVGNSTTIPLTTVSYVTEGAVVSGIGIDASAANPTVVSKDAVSGAGNIVVSAAQTLESGQTLVFEGSTSFITLIGNIEVSNMAIGNVDLFLDVEKFLIAK